MHVTEIIIDGQAIDTYTDKNFKYKMQVNKIASLKDREASFMPATNVPKTAKNKRLLQGLGIPSDTSAIPYLKPNCELRIDGFNFITKGWIGFEEAGDDYKIKIYSGIIQFFKFIEGKTLGNDLDLSIIDKPKKLDTVIESFTNPAFRYMITDYNGKTHYTKDNEEIVNIDYLVPSVNVAFLWDLIHKTFGFTYSGLIFSSTHFNNLWITYPKPIEQPVETKLNEVHNHRDYTWYPTPVDNPETWYRPIVDGGFPIESKAFKAPKTGKYRLKMRFDARVLNASALGIYFSVNQLNTPYLNRPNSYTVAFGWEEPVRIFEQNRTIDLNEGDVVDFYTSQYWTRNALGRFELFSDIEFIFIEDAGADFTEELKDFLITDFIKDIYNQFGLTPYTNEHNNNVDYKLITERYATAEVVDWSDKYVRRKDEIYIFDSYAKKNYFRWQYNDKGSDYHDGSLNIPNMNLAEQKDIYKSKMYSPERGLVKFPLGSIGSVDLRVFKMYDKNVRESGGETKIEYKSLDKRFHYCRSAILDTTVKIGSETYQEIQTVTSVAVIDYSGLAWVNLLETFYSTMGRILIDARVHEIELNLDPTDVILLDQSKMIYFEQEHQYYVIDSIEYDGDEIGTGKFIRVKRDPNAIVIPEDPSHPEYYTIPVSWEDGTSADRETADSTVTVKMGQIGYPVSDPVTSTNWERFINGVWITDEATAPTNTLQLVAGDNKLRVRALTQKGKSYYSNELRIFRKTFVCNVFEVRLYPQTSQATLVVVYDNCRGEQVVESRSNHWGSSNVLVITGCGVAGSVNHNGNWFEQRESCN